MEHADSNIKINEGFLIIYWYKVDFLTGNIDLTVYFCIWNSFSCVDQCSSYYSVITVRLYVGAIYSISCRQIQYFIGFLCHKTLSCYIECQYDCSLLSLSKRIAEFTVSLDLTIVWSELLDLCIMFLVLLLFSCIWLFAIRDCSFFCSFNFWTEHSKFKDDIVIRK